MKLIITSVLLCCNMASALAQGHPVQISFLPTMHDEIVVTGKKYFLMPNADTIQIDRLAFYISDICFLKNNDIVFCEPDSHHLLTCDDEIQQLDFAIDVSDKSFDAIRFSLGIDSLTNVSGARGGDLDPTNGMYWTWQSGYINFKIEGHSYKSTARKHDFQFHIGGYAGFNNALQIVELPAKDTDQIAIQLDLSQMLGHHSMAETNHIMSPGSEAVDMAKKLAQSFSILR